MSSRNDSTNDGPLPATRVFNRKGATEALREEIRRYGLPDQDREAQMLCRLAFSVCPSRLVSRRLVEECRWIKRMDEIWICRHQGLRYPNSRGKVTMAIMRDLQRKLDKLRAANTVALFSVNEQTVTLKTVSPEPIVLPL